MASVAGAARTLGAGATAAKAVPACTDSWTNPAGGDWSTAANWSAGVPTGGSAVCITLAGTYTVEIAAAAGTETIAGLTIGAGSGTQTLQIDAGAQVTSNGPVLNQTGGAISNQGTFLMPTNQTFTQENGTTAGNRITISNAFLAITGTGASSFAISAVGNSQLNGSIAASQSIQLNSANLQANGPLTNAGTITATGTSNNLSASGGAVTNTGLIRAEAGNTGTLTLNGPFVNSATTPGGIVANSNVTLTGSGTLTNAGPFTVAAAATFTNSGTITNNTGGSIANSGTFTSTTNAHFNQDAGTTSGNPVTISNAYLSFLGGGGAGSFAITPVGTSILDGSMSATESLQLNSASVSWAGPVTSAGTISAGGSSNSVSMTGGAMTSSGLIRAETGNTGTFTLSGTFSSSGSIVANSNMTLSGGSLTNTGSFTVGADATVTNSGTVSNNTGGSISNAGVFTSTTNAVFNENAGTATGNAIVIRNAFLNFPAAGGGGASAFQISNVGSSNLTGSTSSSESIELASATVSWVGGPLTNAGTITASGTSQALNVSGGMTNTGTIRAEAGNTGTFAINGAFTSSGTITDNSKMSLTGSLTNSGAFTVGSGATFTNSGTITHNAGGAITNNGIFTSTTNTVFNENEGTASGNPIVISNAFLNFQPAGGGGAAAFQVTTIGSSNITGSTSSGESIELMSATVSWVGGPLTNAGTITASGTSQALNVSGGMINTGTIRAEAGNTGTFALSGAFTSSGAITANSNMSLSGSITNTGSFTVGSAATFTNSGTVTNNAGGSISNGGVFTSTSSTHFNEDAGTTSGNPIVISNSFLSFTGSGASTFSITNIGSSNVTGTISAGQTLILQASATENGSLTSNGTVVLRSASSISGSLANGGTLHLEGGASPATITGSYTQSSGGSLVTDLGDATSFGRVNISGAATIDGNLTVNTTFTPTTGATFQILHSNGTRLGTFASYSFGSRAYSTAYTANAVILTAVDPLAITTATLPNGAVGTPYSQTLATSGGTGAVTWTVPPGTLPAGLSLSSAGVISGTPTTAGTVTFTVTATDSGTPSQSTSKTLSITIVGPLNVTTTSLPSGVVGTPYPATTLQTSGGTPPITWTVPPGTLPAGLSLSSDGVISGTPTASGTSTFTVTATDSGSPVQSATASLSITIIPALVVTTTSLPSGIAGMAYPGATLASSGGTPPVTWSVPPGALPTGLTLNTATGAISGTPTTAGTTTFTVTATDSGSPAQTATKSLQIVVAAPLTVTTTSLPSGVVGSPYPGATLASSGGTGAVTWSVPPGSLPAGLSLNGTTGAISGTPTAAGTSSFTVTATDSGSPVQTATKSLSITIAGPLVVTTTSLPSGIAGTPYAGATLASSGGTGAVSWSVPPGSLPNGLTLNSATGSISGTPTTAGTSTFTVTATDSGSPVQTATKSLSITIAAPLVVTTTSLPSGTVGTAYPGATLASSGGTGAVSWSVPPGSLPNGLTLSSSTGAISGTPTAAGTFTFTVTATDSGSPAQTATKSLSIVIAGAQAGLAVATTSLPNGTIGQPYPSTTLQSSGGTAPVTWSVPPGSLPAGLSLNGTTGAITGTPTATGTSTFTVTATDSSDPVQTATKSLSITIGTGGHGVILTSSLNPSVEGQSVTFTAVVSPSTATGTVRFYDATTKIGRDATISDGVATFTTDSLAAGSHQITAQYKGNATNPAATSDPLNQVVNPKTATTTTLQRLPDPPKSHRTVSIQATVAPGSPTGYVTFYDGSTKLGRAAVGAGGVAIFNTTALAVGSHQITGQYGGDDDNAASTSPVLTVIVS